MKLPQKAPTYVETVKGYLQTPGIFTLSNSLENDGQYRHWDEIRRRTPPQGFSHKEWWAAIKIKRGGSQRPLPLLDKANAPFKFYPTDSVQKLLHEIDSGAGGFIGVPDAITNPQTRDRYVISSLIEEAFTSSQLEGAVSTRLEAKEMIKSGRKPRDRSEQMILNNFRTMQHLREVKDETLTSELVFSIHRQITEGALDIDDAAGRFRIDEEKIKVMDAEGSVLHDPPPTSQLSERMQLMCEFANSTGPDGGFIHPVVRAIILHFWLAYDHPFCDGNGRTARALFYWAMLRYGYWLFEYVSISSILVKAPARYARSFLYTESDENDLNYFITYQTEVISQAIKNLHRYIERKQNEVRGMDAQIKFLKELNHRQQSLVIHALRHPQHEYSIASHKRSHGIAYGTSRMDLLRLAKLGLLHQVTRSRTMFFRAAHDLNDRLQVLSSTSSQVKATS